MLNVPQRAHACMHVQRYVNPLHVSKYIDGRHSTPAQADLSSSCKTDRDDKPRQHCCSQLFTDGIVQHRGSQLRIDGVVMPWLLAIMQLQAGYCVMFVHSMHQNSSSMRSTWMLDATLATQKDRQSWHVLQPKSSTASAP